jgi:hypothetical protein
VITSDELIPEPREYVLATGRVVRVRPALLDRLGPDLRGARREGGGDVLHVVYLYSLTRGMPQALRGRMWPRITRFDDRWRWIETSIVPRFRRFDADARLVDSSLRRIFDEARDYAGNPCVLPRRAS